MRAYPHRTLSPTDVAPVLFWHSRLDGTPTYYGTPQRDFLGRWLELAGTSWSARIHPDDVDRCTAVYSAAFHSRQEFVIEYRLRRHDGAFRWVLDRGTPVYQPDGTFVGLIGGCVDITERKQAEHLYASAEQAFLAIGMVAAGAGDAVDATDTTNSADCAEHSTLRAGFLAVTAHVARLARTGAELMREARLVRGPMHDREPEMAPSGGLA